MPNSKDSRTVPEAQEGDRWAPPDGPLGELIDAAWTRSKMLDSDGRRIGFPEAVSLRAALLRDTVSVVAEIKRRSPSRGEIRPHIDAGAQAMAYEAGGAAAISVLTEQVRFGGADNDVLLARKNCKLPILRKDFHVTASQLVEARHLGASAALIIVRAIEPSRLDMLAEAARDVGLEIVFEVRDERELARALAAGAEIVGVNNRDLETLVVDPDTVERIVPLVPPECIAIAESGYSTRADVEKAAAAGADAVLVGSYVSAAEDPASAVRAISGVAKTNRRGQAVRRSLTRR